MPSKTSTVTPTKSEAVTVRNFVLDDVDEIVRMGNAWVREAPASFPMPEYDVVTESAQMFLADPKLGRAFLTEIDGTVTGFAVVMRGAHLFSRHAPAVCQYFYVKPEYRGTRSAALLEERVSAWAARSGLTPLLMDVTTGIRGADLFFKRSGYMTVGSKHMKEV